MNRIKWMAISLFTFTDFFGMCGNSLSQNFLVTISRFVSKERSGGFSNAQRSNIVWHILSRTVYDKKGRSGIGRLLARDVYKAAFPLHDGEYDYSEFEEADSRHTPNIRKVIKKALLITP